MKHKELFAQAVTSANAILTSQNVSLTELSQKRVLHKLVKEAYVQLYLVEKEILKEKKQKPIAAPATRPVVAKKRRTVAKKTVAPK